MWWHGKKGHPEESKKWHYSKQTGALVVTTIDASMVHLPSFMKEKKESIYIKMLLILLILGLN